VQCRMQSKHTQQQGENNHNLTYLISHPPNC
jgi:hypothetical protein